jgi:hypothetical protein
MKKPTCFLFALGLAVAGARADVAFKSMTQLAFGPDGVLFVADPKAAAIVALSTGDTQAAASGATIKVEGLNQKIAALLGTAADQIIVSDIAANPVSRQVYVTVSRGRGPDATPVLVRVKTNSELEVVATDKMKSSRAELPDPPKDELTGQANRQRNPRTESITDIAFAGGRVLIAGLANEEFASTLRAIPYPFQAVDRGTTVEIYHGAHGAFETRAPVRTLVSYGSGKDANVLAAYTCTPLVQFALSELKPGAKIQGKTIAEFGNGNQPLDMIVYQKDGKDYLLLANSRRGVIKVAAEQISGAGSITAKVADTQGLAFEKIAWNGVTQLDRFDARHAIVVKSGAAAGSMDLETVALP